MPHPEDSLIVAGTFALFAYLFLANSWVGDDSYIAFRVVDNFINGYGLRWNPVERVQAFTDPLWVLLLSCFYFFTHEIFYTSLAVSFALCFAALALTRRAFPKLDQWLLAAALLFSSKAFVDYTSSGLEYPLLYALAAALYVALMRLDTTDAERSSRATFGFGLLAALAFVCRMDVILLFVPALVWLAWVRWRAFGAKGMVPLLVGGLPALIWVAFAVVYYGFAFPNTYYAKADAGFPASIQMRQGVAYLANSLRFDPITLVITATAIGSSLAGERRHRLIGIAALLNLAYVIWIGGDFMSGRFLAPAFLLCALSTAALVTRRETILAAIAVLIAYNLIWPNVPAKTTASYDMAWPWRTQNAIKDERGGYHQATNVLFFAAFTPRPDDVWARDGYSVRMSPDRVFVRPSIGRVGFLAGPDKYIIDPNALSDPLLARLPVDESVYFEFWMSHFGRAIPDGYVESRVAGRNLIADPLIHDYYDRLLRVTTGPIWSSARFGDIYALNFGKYRQFHRQVAERRQVSVSVRAGNPRFSTDVGRRDDVRDRISSTGRAGLLVLGPSIPLRAGRYEVEWNGILGQSTTGSIGFVVVCYAGCTKILNSNAVYPEAYKPESHTIATATFEIKQPVADIEYRFFVEQGAVVTLERIGFHGGPVLRQSEGN